MPVTSNPQPLLIEAQLDALGEWLLPAAKDLPAPVQAVAQRLWLDTLSCAWAGLRADEPLRWLQVQHVGDAGKIPLPGTHLKFSASTAVTALAMGACWEHRINEIDSKIRAGMVLEKNSSRILGENS